MNKTELDKAYYSGNPSISDEEYDRIFGESPEVGAEEGEIPHTFPMFSLKKHYPDMGEPPLSSTDKLVETPKLDGAAVSLLFQDKKFRLGLTRGDGRRGRDITDKLRIITGITEVPYAQTLQIIGEVVIHKSHPNARNLASGSLNLKSTQEFLERIDAIEIEFIAYGVQGTEGVYGLSSSYLEDMALLSEWGFNTVLDKGLEVYPLDGKVFRVDSNKKFSEMGVTSSFPRGAYALKERQEPTETTLLDVIWQTGKSGKVTPVALLEPIMINGAKISRATLNNMAYINALNLEIGCKVGVIRSGEIIPCIVSRLD